MTATTTSLLRVVERQQGASQRWIRRLPGRHGHFLVTKPRRYLRTQLARRFGFRPWAAALLVTGHHLRVDLRDFNGGNLFRWGAPGLVEFPLLYWMARNLGGTSSFFDVGANHGFFSVLALDLGSPSVVAFEPNPELAGCLRTIDPHGAMLRTFQLALSDRDGDALLSVPTGFTGKGSLGGTDIPSADYEVPCRRLETLLTEWPELPPPCFVKIDVEGHEAAVLRGFPADLPPTVSLEVHRSRTGAGLDSESREALSVASDLGYRFFALGANGEERPVGSFSDWTGDDNLSRFGYTNVLCRIG